jgi:metal-responsive CopG/Arc/MetJ family transcriptional regulator
MPTKIRMIAVKLPVDVIARLEAVVTRRYSNRSVVLRERVIHGVTEEEKRLAQLDAETRRHFEQYAPTEAA